MARGAEVVTGTRVTGIRLDPRGRVRGVETTRGEIRAERVVNAAGQWAPRVAAMAGVDLPIVPLMHQYLITRPVPGQELPRETPVVRDPENLVYVREEVGGYLVGGFEPHPKAWRLDDVPWEFTQQLLPAEWELFEPLLAGAIRRFPAVEKAEILQLVNGPDGFTPDGHYALGPVPGRPGFWVAAGMSINGIAGAGGVGRVMAEWILEGEPSIDVWELNVRRFGAHLRDRRYAAEKAREVYRYYYAPQFPCDENEWGRPLRTSPLLERLLARGRRVRGARGLGAGPLLRSRAARPAAGRRRADLGAPELLGARGARAPGGARARGRARHDVVRQARRDRPRGPRRSSSGSAANDVDRPAGSLVYTQCLNARGGIECDVTVTRLGESAFRVTTGTGSAAGDLGWLRLHLPDDGSVELADVTERHAVVSLWGPDSRRTLAKVSRDDLSTSAFPYLTSRVIDVGGVEVRANRVSFAGELGYELVAPADGAGRVWDAVLAAGREFGIEPVGYYALNTLRLEKCFYYWGDDVCPSDTPLEANLGFCVRFDKGDFIGRDALLRQRAAGPERKLVPLVLDGECVRPLGRRGRRLGGERRRPGAERRLRPHGRAERRARVPSGGAGAAGYRRRGGVVRAAGAGGGPDGPALGSRGASVSGPDDPAEYRGRRLRVRRERHTLPDGRRVSLDAVRVPAVAYILPLLDDGRVVLIRQYRPIVGAEIWELPAGTIEAGESPEACARRELVEEAGYEAGRLEPLGEALADPGLTDERIFLFVARELRPVPRGLDADEHIEVGPGAARRGLPDGRRGGDPRRGDPRRAVPVPEPRVRLSAAAIVTRRFERVERPVGSRTGHGRRVMPRVAFMGGLSWSFADRVRAHLTVTLRLRPRRREERE